MGQRHQLIVKYNEITYKKGEKISEIKKVCFHNQWCFGRLPIFYLSSIADFNSNQTDIKYELNNSEFIRYNLLDIIQKLWGASPRFGIVNNNTDFNCGDIGMLETDNNNGWTLLDLTRDDAIYYCFIAGCEEEDKDTYEKLSFRPLTGKEYHSFTDDYLKTELTAEEYEEYIKPFNKGCEIIDKAGFKLMSNEDISFFK
jgi:hypothetical protein